jgi:3-hydroxyisobutyrate dehydrogenase
MRKRIGFIGAGTMGAPMAENLYRAGFPVTVYNRTRAKLTPLMEKGLATADDLAGAVADKDVIITMLSDDAAVKEVVLGDEGVLTHCRPGTVLIDMSTVSPDTAIEISQRSKENGVHTLDAPVSGSQNAAQSAQLVVLAGGDQHVFSEMSDVFAALAKASYYFGGPGSGAKAKLVVNLLLAVTMQGISEALVLAESFGLKREQILEMMQQTVLASPFLTFKRELLSRGEFPAAFALKHMHKDLGLITEQARTRQAILPATTSVQQTYTAALNHGRGEQDMAAVFAELLHQAGLY